MFCPLKNSYLQLVCAMNPRVINMAVDQAMERPLDPHDAAPAAHRMDSMQPSLYAPCVDITRARVGFGRGGLKNLVRQLHSELALERMQAVHSIMDKVQIAEDAMFLIKAGVVFRIADLMHSRNPVIREKVCITLTYLATYHQGRIQILKHPDIIYDLRWIILKDRKEIRYAAAKTLRTLSRDRCSCEKIRKTPNMIENLLEIVQNELGGTVEIHLKTLENLIEWDPLPALKNNAFKIMLALMDIDNTKIVCRAMDCMAQLLSHEVGRKLSDSYDLTFALRKFMQSPHTKVVLSAVALLKMTTLTTQSKWRAKEFCVDLTNDLVKFCHSPNSPLLQLSAMQVLLNLCECPDIRSHVKKYHLKSLRSMRIGTHEEWNGTSETSSYGLETGHNYRTMCIEPVETIKNEYGDNALAINVHSYLGTVRETQRRLLKAITWKPHVE